MGGNGQMMMADNQDQWKTLLRAMVNIQWLKGLKQLRTQGTSGSNMVGEKIRETGEFDCNCYTGKK